MKTTSHIILLASVMLVTACKEKEQVTNSGTPAWFSPDYGPSLHVSGRECTWDATSVNLGDTGFIAYVGPHIYKDEDNDDPDYYSIDVEYKQEDGSLVCYSRDFELKDLPDGLLESEATDIVRYNADNRMVTFQIGTNKYQYQLPLTK